MPHIITTIASVRGQSYQNWELIICDNMSKDGTAEAVQADLTKNPDPRIRFVTHNELLNMGANWNRSLSYATGDFIKLLPADDILAPDCLEVQQRVLQDKPAIGFVTSGKEVINAKGRVLFRRSPLKEGVYDWNQLGCRIITAVVNIISEPGGVLFRRELLKTCGPYDAGLCYYVDIEILLRFLKKSMAYVCSAPLYQFRVHGTSGTVGSHQRALTEYRRILDNYATDLRLAQRPWLRPYLEAKSQLVVMLRGLIVRLYVQPA